MRMRSVVVSTIASVFLAACQHNPPATQSLPAVQHFSIVVEHSSSGWTAHCDQGCQWSNVTLGCADCNAQLDAAGISKVDAAAKPQGFAFMLESQQNGLAADAIQGVT